MEAGKEEMLFREAQKAWVRNFHKNIGLGIVWSKEYRRLMNMTADQRLPLSERTHILNILCAHEAVIHIQHRLLNAPEEIAARLRAEQEQREEISEVIV